MRIDNIIPAFNLNLPQLAAAVHKPIIPEQTINFSYPGVIVSISPEGWAASERIKAAAEASAAAEANKAESVSDKYLGCETCDSRRYQDVSSDSSVSFQSPTHISPEQSAAVVRAHEYEHVANEQVKAKQEDRKVISQTVSLHSSVCPECNCVYISGGVARTITADDKGGDTLEHSGHDSTSDASA
jgi:hypothetical protein